MAPKLDFTLCSAITLNHAWERKPFGKFLSGTHVVVFHAQPLFWKHAPTPMLI